MRFDFYVSLLACLFALDFPIQSKLYLSDTTLFIICIIMNYPIPPTYQPEQSSYLPYQAKPMTMDYMPEYSAPVSSISSTPEVPVQPIPVAPVSTVIPMSPEPNYLPQGFRRAISEYSPLENPDNRLTAFLNESMFYIDFQNGLSSKGFDYRVYPTNLYGEMDDSGSPIMTVRVESGSKS